MPDYELCFYLKGLGGVYEVTPRGVILALFRADPGLFTLWSRRGLTHRRRCPRTGDGGVGKPLGIPKGLALRHLPTCPGGPAAPVQTAAHWGLNISGRFSFWFQLRKS